MRRDVPYGTSRAPQTLYLRPLYRLVQGKHSSGVKVLLSANPEKKAAKKVRLRFRLRRDKARLPALQIPRFQARQLKSVTYSIVVVKSD